MNKIYRTTLMNILGVNNDELNQLLYLSDLPSDADWYEESDLQKLEQYIGYQKRLEKLTDGCILLLDTSAVLHPMFFKLMEHLLPILLQTGQNLILPCWVREEMIKVAKDQPYLINQINAASSWIIQMEKEGVLKIFGESSATFGDPQLLAVVTKMFVNHRVLVIVQDYDLSNDLLDLNRLQSVRGKEIRVCRINRYGYLSRFHHQNERSIDQVIIPSSPLIIDQKQLLPIDLLPATGDYVTSISGTMILGDKLGSGGEGTIYDLADGTVAKIYQKNRLTAARRDKLQLMISHPISCEGLCWPKELLYNRHGQFVGYRMAKAEGVSLQRCLLSHDTVLRYFPSGKRIELVQLAVTILEKISTLHKVGVLLGDINLNNILMVSPKEVWLVDCDSY